jgi:hypothetical protein
MVARVCSKCRLAIAHCDRSPNNNVKFHNAIPDVLPLSVNDGVDDVGIPAGPVLPVAPVPPIGADADPPTTGDAFGNDAAPCFNRRQLACGRVILRIVMCNTHTLLRFKKAS